jgi:hypothetical protein
LPLVTLKDVRYYLAHLPKRGPNKFNQRERT